MTRVAIHLSSSPPTVRNMLRAAFRQVQHAGGRVVTLAQDAAGEEDALGDLIYRLGDDFDQLFRIVGNELYEVIVQGDDPLDGASVITVAH
jgi:hypothetical protein